MMDLTGRVCEVSRDYKTKKPVIKFLINEEPHGIEDFDGKDLKIKVTRGTKPRSLDANAYFHVLCDQLRQKLNISMTQCKNILITSYGQIDYLDEGEAIEYTTNAPIEYIMEQAEPHLKFLRINSEGKYVYMVYRGSHTYNVHEMHKLLEGTIQECVDQGIEVRTPDEIRRMEQLWNVKLLMKGEKHEHI